MDLFLLSALILVVRLVPLVVLVKVAYDTLHRGRWGIPLGPVACSRCGTRQPVLRTPRSARQALWGGYTCATCGAELDTWGRVLEAA